MAGQGDFNATLTLDTSQAQQQAVQFARNFPAIKVKADFGNGLGIISRQSSEFERSLASAQARVVAFGLAAGSIYKVAQAFDELVKSTIDVQKDLANINAILGLSSNGLNQFSSKLFGIANTTAQSFKVTAEAALNFARQGLGTEEVLKRTAAALSLVRIGGADLDTSIKAITSTLNVFNEAGLDAAAILNRIATVDTKFSVSGNVIAEALTRVASTAKETGVTFNSLIGITTALQQITSRGGAVIGNSLKAIFTRVTRPETIDQLNQMGIATEDLNGNMLAADAILGNLAKKYDGLTAAQKGQINNLAAGLFQINQFRALIEDLAKTNGIAARATETASTATDQATRRQVALNQTLSAQLQTVQNNLVQFAAKAGNLSIAPALENIFKGLNIATGPQDALGQNLGEGILKGLGNYLSGPGLALLGVLAGKFFLQFSTYAATALTKVIEGNSVRYQQEQSIQALLARQPGLLEKIVALGNDEASIQKLLLQTFAEQNAVLNQRVAVVNKLAAMSVTPVSIPFLNNSSSKILNSSGNEATLNTKFVPPFSLLSDSLSEAVTREKAMGVDPSTIKIGTSSFLTSPDNPYGLGVYNTKDEPLGLGQGIQRLASKGIDPKKAGSVPNFADANYYQNVNSPFKDPFNRPPGDSLLSLESSLNLKSEIDAYKSLIKDGIVNQASLNQKVKDLSGAFNLTEQSTKDIQKSLQQSFIYFSGKNNRKQLDDPATNAARLDARIQALKNNETELPYTPPTSNQFFGNQFEKRRVLITPPPDDFLKSERRRISYEQAGIDRYNSRRVKPDFIGIEPSSTESLARQQKIEQARLQRQSFLSGISGESQSLPSYESYLQNQSELYRQDKLSSNAKQISSLNLGSVFTGKYSRIQASSKELGQEGEFAKVSGGIQNQALLASFIAPLVAGVAQQAFSKALGDDTTGKRAGAAALGGIGNVASYAGLGLTIGGVPGAIAGGVGGLLLELPAVINALNDTLPDLKRHLDELKDSTTKINDSFTSYINVYQQLQDINSGASKVSIGQRNQLLNQQQQSFNNLPSEAQGRIREAIKSGRPDEIYSIASEYNTQAQQNIAAQQDIAELYSSNGKYSPIYPDNFLSKRGKPVFNSSTGNFDYPDLAELSANPKIKEDVNSIFSFQNQKGLSLQQILQSSNPNDLKTLDSSGLVNLLKKNGFSEQSIQSVSGLTEQINKQGGGAYLNKRLTPESINQTYQDNQDYIVAATKQQKEIDTLNSKLANLTVTGTEAVNNFEINVITKLSQSLTKLKLQGISEETSAKIAEIRGGQNDYSKAYFDYIRQNNASRNQYQGQVSNATSQFSNKVGNDFYGVVDNFTKGLQGTGKNKTADLTGLVEDKRKELNTVLAGYFGIDKNFSVTTLKNNYSPNDVTNISSNINNKIKELENQKNTVGGSLIPDASTLLSSTPGAKNVLDAIYKSGNSRPASELSGAINKLHPSIANNILGLTPETIDDANTSRQNIDKIITSYQSLLEKLTKNSADLKKSLTEASNNLDSDLQVNSKKLLDSVSILGEQFKSNQSNSLFSGNINRQFSAKAFGFQEQALVSDPEAAIRLKAQAQNQPAIAKILDDLNIQTKLGITNPDNIKSQLNRQTGIYNNLINSPQENKQAIIDTKSKIESLTKALDDLGEVSKNSSEKIRQEIESLSPFSDVRAGALKQKNIQIASNGDISSSDYKNAFFAPLKYNQNDFQRDTVVGLQDFSETIKKDLTSSLLEATKGAKNAGQAFAQLGIALASDVASKATNIGISQLLNVATSKSTYSGIASFFGGKSGGGYISKYSNGGIVNMGSGNKDDVPALLTGGEFVINKNAVARVGKSNLDFLNNGNIQSDSISSGNGAANLTLANAFTFSSNSSGNLNTSPLLSALGQTDQNNPQNRIKFARERFLFSRNLSYTDYKRQLDEYNTQQNIALGSAYLGAIGNVVGAFAGTRSNGSGGGTGPTGGSFNSPYSEAGASSASFGDSAASYRYSAPNFSSYGIVHAAGGYIPKLASGGSFGGDSSSDKFRAMVMGGEYIVSPKTVNKYGVNFFKSLNNTAKYASGGYVPSGTGGNDELSKVVSTLEQIRDSLSSAAPKSNTQANNNTPNQTNNVTVNISMASDGKTSSNTSVDSKNSNNDNKSSKDNTDAVKKFGNNIQALILTTVTKESRPGGLLYQTFQLKKT